MAVFTRCAAGRCHASFTLFETFSLGAIRQRLAMVRQGIASAIARPPRLCREQTIEFSSARIAQRYARTNVLGRKPAFVLCRPICQAPVPFPRQMGHCHCGQEESGECLTPTQLIQSFFVSLPSDPNQAHFHFCATRVAILSAAGSFCRSIFHAGQASCGSAGVLAAGKTLREMRLAARAWQACFEFTSRRVDRLSGIAVSLRKYLTETVQFLLRKWRCRPAPVRLFRGETS